MNNTYKVKVDQNQEFELTEKDILEVDTLLISDQNYHIIDNHLSYHSKVLNSNFNHKEYTIEVNNTHYQVTISNALDVQIAAMGFSVGGAKQVNAIKAPMPGLLLDIHIEVGQEVKENDPLLILEAMKMENVIVSPRDGKIKAIGMRKGQ